MTTFVVDASVIVSAALRLDGTPNQAIDQAARFGTIALSSAVFDEIVGVLGRPKFKSMIAPARRAEIVEMLRASAIWQEPTEQVTDCRDAKDNKYLDLALAVGAVVIISGDTDLLVLDPWRHVRIMTPGDFLSWVVAGGLAKSSGTR